MKCLSAAIRTVCLVLSVQIVAFSDAKSIGPSLSASTNSSDGGGGVSDYDSTLLTRNGANDPPSLLLLAGQDREFSRSRRIPVTVNKYVPKYTIEHLQEHIYGWKISNDIDLDPCKTGN